jgi:ketosteroid isomerase-like protein
MTAEEVLRVHRDIFYRSLIDQDFDALAVLYANDYMLVRSDGSVLNKESVLRDLMGRGLTFTSIELVGEEVRIYGETAIVTGESRTLARRDSERLASRFRLVAVYTSQAEMVRLVHFQSTALPIEPNLGS